MDDIVPGGYIGHVAQHKGQHLLSCNAPNPAPHVLIEEQNMNLEYMALNLGIYYLSFDAPPRTAIILL